MRYKYVYFLNISKPNFDENKLWHINVHTIDFSIEVTTQDIVTPSFVVSSELRSVNQLGSPVSSATVGDTIYWTIDIPGKFWMFEYFDFLIIDSSIGFDTILENLKRSIK